MERSVRSCLTWLAGPAALATKSKPPRSHDSKRATEPRGNLKLSMWKGWMTHTYLLYNGENIKEQTAVRLSSTKQLDKMYSSQTTHTWLCGAKHTAYSLCWLLRPMDYNHGHPGYIWTKIDSYFPIMDKVWIDQKKVNLKLWISISKYIFQQSICGWVWDVLKAVVRVLLDTIRTCCQYVELILETVERIWGKWKR